MKVFVLFAEYYEPALRRVLYGVFSSRENAIAAADEMKRASEARMSSHEYECVTEWEVDDTSAVDWFKQWSQS